MRSVSSSKIIADKLEVNEVVVYTLPDFSQTFVSNKGDTVCLESKDQKEVIYYEALPAKGRSGE